MWKANGAGCPRAVSEPSARRSRFGCRWRWPQRAPGRTAGAGWPLDVGRGNEIPDLPLVADPGFDVGLLRQARDIARRGRPEDEPILRVERQIGAERFPALELVAHVRAGVDGQEFETDSAPLHRGIIRCPLVNDLAQLRERPPALSAEPDEKMIRHVRLDFRLCFDVAEGGQGNEDELQDDQQQPGHEERACNSRSGSASLLAAVSSAEWTCGQIAALLHGFTAVMLSALVHPTAFTTSAATVAGSGTLHSTPRVNGNCDPRFRLATSAAA